MTTVVVQEDENGELYIELPPDLIEQLGWDENTEVLWVVEDDGKIILRKRETDDSSNET